MMRSPFFAATPPCDRIALYGSLMQGLGALDALALSHALQLEGPCVIPGRLFDLGPYPGLRLGDGRVAGELYRIESPDALARLDDFEGFEPERPSESLYVRLRLTLLEPADRSAWVYLYNHEPAPAALVPHGDWRAHLRTREAEAPST